MENKEIKVESATTEKQALTLKLGKEEISQKELVEFVIRQSNLKDYGKAEMLYIINTCKEKGLNPMKGEISFFKGKNGMLNSIPKYTTQLDKLYTSTGEREQVIHLSFDSKIYTTDTGEWVAEYIEHYLWKDFKEAGPQVRSYKLFAGDMKCTNGMARLMLLKQASQQFIRLYYPEKDLGYDEDELKSFDSGLNEKTKPQDHRRVDIQVQPKALEK